MKIHVSAVAPSKTVTYRETPCVVLEHRQDGTLLLSLEPIESEFGETNNFVESDLRRRLNGHYLASLTQSHPDEIIARTVDLTALNGSKEYGEVRCKAAPLTLDELRKYHDILPDPEGTEWSATAWPTHHVDTDQSWVVTLTDHCDIDGCGGYHTRNCRPAFVVRADCTVDDGNDQPEIGNPLERYSTRDLMMELWRRTGEKNEQKA